MSNQHAAPNPTGLFAGPAAPDTSRRLAAPAIPAVVFLAPDIEPADDEDAEA